MMVCLQITDTKRLYGLSLCNMDSSLLIQFFIIIYSSTTNSLGKDRKKQNNISLYHFKDSMGGAVGNCDRCDHSNSAGWWIFRSFRSNEQ